MRLRKNLKKLKFFIGDFFIFNLISSDITKVNPNSENMSTELWQFANTVSHVSNYNTAAEMSRKLERDRVFLENALLSMSNDIENHFDDPTAFKICLKFCHISVIEYFNIFKIMVHVIP